MKLVTVRIFFITITYLFATPLLSVAQNNNSNIPTSNTVPINTSSYFTLQQCIDYALLNQPGLNKTLIDIDIAKTTNAINLSGWLPQITAGGNLLHYLQLGSIANTNANQPQVTNQPRFNNTFIPQLSASQSLFNPSILYAAKSAPSYVKKAEQISDSTRINVIAAVTKSFYNVLLTLEQISVLKEDTTRLGSSMDNAYHRYKGGIADETDYQQAAIALNNSKAQLILAKENIKPQYATLKQLIGYPTDKHIQINFDTLQMIKNIYIDTTQQLHYEKRIEYQQLKTQRVLQRQLTSYYKYAFLPTASVFYNYSLGFQSSQFSTLFDSESPTSVIGLSVSIPLFTGLSRSHNLHKAKLQEKIVNWSEADLKLQINREYATALASYKSNLYNYEMLQKNVSLAKRVYFIVDLQYKQGIVAYLNVITAEANLITAQINYLNALFQVLSSRVDLQKAMGTI